MDSEGVLQHCIAHFKHIQTAVDSFKSWAVGPDWAGLALVILAFLTFLLEIGNKKIVRSLLVRNEKATTCVKY